MKTKNIISKVILHAILIAACVCVLFPIAYTVLASFKTNAEILTKPENLFPEHFSFENYVTAWNSKNFDVKIMVLNSLYYTVLSVIITLITSVFPGYAFARGKFRLKGFWFGVFSAMMFITLGSISIYPQFDVFAWLHIPITLNGLIFTKVFGVSTVNILLVRSYIMTLPVELDEAARIDGCSFIGTGVRVIFPLIVPIAATIGMLAFQSSWNDYLMPMVFTMSTPSQRTLIVGLMALKGSDGAASSWNLMLAGSVIAMIPVIIMFLIGNKYIIGGLVDGAVKG